jgi:hypothetical protein
MDYHWITGNKLLFLFSACILLMLLVLARIRHSQLLQEACSEVRKL